MYNVLNVKVLPRGGSEKRESLKETQRQSISLIGDVRRGELEWLVLQGGSKERGRRQGTLIEYPIRPPCQDCVQNQFNRRRFQLGNRSWNLAFQDSRSISHKWHQTTTIRKCGFYRCRNVKKGQLKKTNKIQYRWTLSTWISTSSWEQLWIFWSTALTTPSTSTIDSFVMLPITKFHDYNRFLIKAI